MGHTQGVLHSITTSLWDCTLSSNTLSISANTLSFLQGPMNNLTKETLSLSSALPSDEVLLPSELVPNFEQIFSPSVHWRSWNFRKNMVSHTTQLANSKITPILNARAWHNFTQRCALNLTLHVQVKRQERELKSVWQTAKAPQQLHVQVELYEALTGEVSLKCLTPLASHSKRWDIWWLSGHESQN